MRKVKRLGVLESGAGIGGAEVNLLRLAVPLSRGGWEPVVFVPARGALTHALEERGLAWRQVHTAQGKSTSRYLGRIKVADPFALAYDTALVLRQARAVARMLRAERIDLLHTNSMLAHFTGALAARLAGIPCVWHLQDIVDPRAARGLYRAVLRLGASTLPMRIVCCSRAVADQLDSSRAVVVYNGVDTRLFNPDGERGYRATWMGKGYAFLVGQIGRLTPWKGQALVLSAARLVKEANLPVRFVVIGDDGFGEAGYRRELAAQANRLDLGDRVIFTGWLDDVPGALRSLDALAHPSLLPEPFGLVIAEAMACARPVIVANHPSAREIIGSNQYGLVFPPGDPVALVDSIRCLVENPSLTARLGADGRARVEKDFSLETFGEQMLGVYDSVLAGTGARGS